MSEINISTKKILTSSSEQKTQLSSSSSSSTRTLQQAKAHGRLRAVAVTKTDIHSLFNNIKTNKILQNLIT
jgi:hypothetical protein